MSTLQLFANQGKVTATSFSRESFSTRSFLENKFPFDNIYVDNYLPASQAPYTPPNDEFSRLGNSHDSVERWRNKVGLVICAWELMERDRVLGTPEDLIAKANTLELEYRLNALPDGYHLFQVRS